MGQRNHTCLAKIIENTCRWYHQSPVTQQRHSVTIRQYGTIRYWWQSNGEGVTKESRCKGGRIPWPRNRQEVATVFRHTRGWCHQSSFKRDGAGVAEEIKSREVLKKG